MIEALEVAHQAGVLHRDVKPSNIMLDKDRVVLADFGIAVMEGATWLTASGQPIGSPEYIAPELIGGHKATRAVDLWAVGSTLYYMVIGDTPFRCESSLATYGAIAINEPDPHPGVGPLWPVIQGLLRKKPAERLTAPAALALLHEVLARPEPQPSVLQKLPVILADARPASPGPPFTEGSESFARPWDVTLDPVLTRPPRPRVRVPVLGGVAAVLLVGVLIVVIVNGGGDTAPTPTISIARGSAPTSLQCHFPNCSNVDATTTGFAPNTRYSITLDSSSDSNVQTESFTTDPHGSAEYDQFDYDMPDETVWHGFIQQNPMGEMMNQTTCAGSMATLRDLRGGPTFVTGPRSTGRTSG